MDIVAKELYPFSLFLKSFTFFSIAITIPPLIRLLPEHPQAGAPASLSRSRTRYLVYTVFTPPGLDFVEHRLVQFDLRWFYFPVEGYRRIEDDP
jgi:hypothetical protein